MAARGFKRKSATNSLSTLGDAWSFHFHDDMWSQITGEEYTPNAPDPRSSHTCVLVHESAEHIFPATASMIVFGGMAKSRVTDVASVVSEVWRLDLQEHADNTVSGEWQLLHPSGTPPQARFDHAAIAHQNGLLVYGGCESSSAFSDVWQLEYTGSQINGFARPTDYRWRELYHSPSPPPYLPPPPYHPPPAPSAPPLSRQQRDDRHGPGHAAAALPAAHLLAAALRRYSRVTRRTLRAHRGPTRQQQHGHLRRAHPLALAYKLRVLERPDMAHAL